MEAIAISISETAKALGISRTSTYILINEGKLEIFKLGRRTLVKTASIRRLVEGE